MNVGVIVPGFSADPTDWCIPAVRHFARVLAGQDGVRVFAVRYPYRADRYAIDGAEVIALGGARSRRGSLPALWRRTLNAIASEHRQRPFDVLHAFWATESGLLAVIAGRRLRVPVLVSLAGGELVALRDIGYGDQLRASERVKIALALRLATRVAAGSDYLLRIAHRHTTSEVAWLPLGVDTCMFQPSTAEPSRRLLHVGALTPVKDQFTLLDALARLPTGSVDIVGDGPLRTSLQAHAARLGLSERVCFVGHREHHELPAYYQSAAAFVQSSRHEAQGMVVLEAAASGRPVIGTCVGNMPELAPRACVRVADPAALASVIEAALATPANALPSSDNLFALDTCVRRFRQCYASLAA
jgi:glycosyltransferase involved in cell wall biosynthesis